MMYYDKIVKWQKDIPSDLRVLMFAGYRRHERYAAFCDRYPIRYRADDLLVVAVTPEIAKSSRVNQ